MTHSSSYVSTYGSKERRKKS